VLSVEPKNIYCVIAVAAISSDTLKVLAHRTTPGSFSEYFQRIMISL